MLAITRCDSASTHPFGGPGRKRRGGTRVLLASALVALLSPSAWAEGEIQFGFPGQGQPLKSSTDVRIDVLEAGETVSWKGLGTLTLKDSSGNTLEALVGPAAGPITTAVTSTVALPVGTLRASLSLNQRDIVGIDFFVPVGWDITVKSPSGVVRDGRVHSKQWIFETGSYAPAKAANVSFYALAPGGVGTTAQTNTVIEMKMDGVNGYEYQVSGNRTGLLGTQAGRSVPDPTGSVTIPVEYELYLNVPAKALFNAVTPTVSGFRYQGNGDGCPNGDTVDSTIIVSPSPNGYFSFQTNVDGTYHIRCDINRDGKISKVGGPDLLLIGSTSSTTVPWDATFDGQPIAPGDYRCEISIHVAEFHFAARDMETAFRGLRMFEVNSNLTRTPLRMFWNDLAVQNIPNSSTGEVVMPLDPNPLPAGFPVADQLQLKSPPLSPDDGLSSGAYSELTLVYGIKAPYNLTAPVYRQGNSRGWGAFLDPNDLPAGSKISKGEKAVLDTYTRARIATSTPFTITMIADQDTDQDGCTDLKETCLMGTKIDDKDTDDDGLEDCDEFEFNDNPTDPTLPDTDGDGLCDGAIAVTPAVGDSCIPEEDGNTDGVNDHDPQGHPTETDPADPDTDDDGYCDGPRVPAGQTQCDHPSDNCPLVYNPSQVDSDEDGIGDACDDLDCDPDRDNIVNFSDRACWPTVPPGDPTPTDPCTAGDTTLCIDNCQMTANTDQADLDADGVGNACECDRDGDGVRDNPDLACWPDLPPGNPPPTAPCDDLQTAFCIDNCADTVNAEQADLDGDGMGDVCDCDMDNDGIIDKSTVACWPGLPPGDPPPSAPCEDLQTALCIDNCARTANSEQADLDGDGAGDACDCDVDGDTIKDKSVRECWPGLPPNDPPPSTPCADKQTDLCIDNCVYDQNVEQGDLDGDGAGDTCDCDIDGDTIKDKSTAACWPEVPEGDPPPTATCDDQQTTLCIDNCVFTPNAGQDDRNSDDEGDACECDRDGDGVVDNSARVCWPDLPPGDPTPTDPCADGNAAGCIDNCVDTVNPDQLDRDNDGQGDACECDKDGDGINDSPAVVCWPGVTPPTASCAPGEDGNCIDNCPNIENPDQADLDGDGIGDVCDCDADGDGVKDKSTAECWPGEVPPNSACPDKVTQRCVDNCAVNPNPDQDDLDGDGIGDVCDPDIDGDGLLNDFEDRDGDRLYDPAKDYSNFRNPDTDGGGENDGSESDKDRDPQQPCDDFGGSCVILLEGGGGCQGGGSGAPLGLAFGALTLLGLAALRRRRYDGR
jgi:hypothetical protein